MTENQAFPQDIYMNDCYSFINDNLGTGPWIPLYINQKLPDSSDELFLFSALVPNNLLKDVLSQYAWEIATDSFHPGFVTYFDKGERKADYLRFGREDNIEPILIQRHFWGIKKTFFDVSEEFRHIYNLYYYEYEKRYIAILDDGNEVDVIKVSDDLIEIDVKYLKEYLAIKNSSLVLFIIIDRFTNGDFSELGQEYIQKIRQNDTTICSINISDYDGISDEDIIYSQLLGKKIILV